MKTIIINLAIIAFCLLSLSKPTITSWFPFNVYVERPYTAIGTAFLLVGLIMIHNELGQDYYKQGALDALEKVSEIIEKQSKK